MSLESPVSEKLSRLRDRAAMLATARGFFRDRGICEVDCPSLSANASVDIHIDLMPVVYARTQTRYLHSSPEFGMKRLLADGIGDIYQLSHVFRDSEWSSKHNPEFTLVEWYRVGLPFKEMIDETLDFVRLFFGPLSAKTISYREAFQTYAGIDYVHATSPELRKRLRNWGVDTHLDDDSPRDDFLNLILGLFVEPRLGQGELCALVDYPASQAALSQTYWRNDEQVAERFEIYYEGLELANGYHELTDPVEQYNRFIEANRARCALKKDPLPLDQHFLNALKKGLPDCCGVAVGFDRLMMLRHNTQEIRDILPFGWQDA